jgi:two-component system copper resistance phosphate regulon response regulator CusR
MTIKKEEQEMKRVLVVEDNKDIAMIVEKRLSRQFTIEIAENGEDATTCINANPYDLIVLDLSLPKKSGFDVLKDMRKKSSYPPVLILSGLNAVEDKVKGLKLGADDYLAKPFDIKELVARIDALLRRVPSAQEIVKLAAVDLEMDLVTRKVTRGGTEITLSPREFALLEYLIRKKDKVVTRKEIAEEVWGHKFDAGTNFVDVYINYLRKSIDKDFPRKLITTVYGQGFILKTEE